MIGEGLASILAGFRAHRDDVAVAASHAATNPEPEAERRMLIRTLASLTRFRGANRGANGPRFLATPGYAQPLPVQPSGTSGHIQHYEATLRKCLLSSRSRVRVAVGPQVVQVAYSYSKTLPLE